ncbi:MAG: SDR family oxidoreductase [Actinomycetota bacterium]
MDLGLSGKKVLVTGSTKGIGRAIAERMLDEGASVAICARSADDVEAATAELSAKGTVSGGVVDAGDDEQLRGWVRDSAEALGGIDVYVHNTSAKPARSLDGWQKNFDIDLMALVRGVDEAKPFLKESDAACVISIATTAVNEHFASGANSYSAFKAAVVNYGCGQAQVLGADGIRSNVVSPGPIFIEGGDWDMIKQNMGPFFESTQKVHPGGELGSAADVANAVAFLGSPAAQHITGVNLVVDGGFLKRVNY